MSRRQIQAKDKGPGTAKAQVRGNGSGKGKAKAGDNPHVVAVSNSWRSSTTSIKTKATMVAEAKVETTSSAGAKFKPETRPQAGSPPPPAAVQAGPTRPHQVGLGAIKQRIQSSHMPPCHRHMVFATNFSSMFDLLLSVFMLLDLTAVSGYRMFLGPFG